MVNYFKIFNMYLYLTYLAHNNTQSTRKPSPRWPNNCKSNTTPTNTPLMNKSKKSLSKTWANTLLISTTPKPHYLMTYAAQSTWCSLKACKSSKTPKSATAGSWWTCLSYRRRLRKVVERSVRRLGGGSKGWWRSCKRSLIAFLGLRIWRSVRSLFRSISISIGPIIMLLKSYRAMKIVLKIISEDIVRVQR